MLWHFLVKWRFKALTQDAVIVVWCRLMASGKWSTCPKRNACRVRTCSPPRQRGHRKSPIRSPIHFTKITILMICWWCFRFLLYIVMVLVSLLFSFDFEREWDIRDIMTHYIVLKKKTGDGLPNLLLWFFVNTTNAQRRRQHRDITCPYISGQQLNPGACAGRKLGEKAKHRVEAKIAPLANIMRYHDSIIMTDLHEMSRDYTNQCQNWKKACPNMSQYFFDNSHMFIICPFDDLWCALGISWYLRAQSGRPWPGGSTPSA